MPHTPSMPLYFPCQGCVSPACAMLSCSWRTLAAHRIASAGTLHWPWCERVCAPNIRCALSRFPADCTPERRVDNVGQLIAFLRAGQANRYTAGTCRSVGHLLPLRLLEVAVSWQVSQQPILSHMLCCMHAFVTCQHQRMAIRHVDAWGTCCQQHAPWCCDMLYRCLTPAAAARISWLPFACLLPLGLSDVGAAQPPALRIVQACGVVNTRAVRGQISSNLLHSSRACA